MNMKTLKHFITCLLLAGLAAGCISGGGGFGIRGEGPVIDRKFSVEKIEGISLPGSAKIHLTQGSDQEVRISGQENIMENLDLEVRNEVLNIGNKRNVWHSEPLNIYITLATLRVIKISGSGSVELVNHFSNLKDLDLRISGSGKIDLDAEARDISGNISGSGGLYLKGSANSLDFNISGSGSVNAYDMTVRKADVRISGSGGMELTVEHSLDAHITGSGSIYYRGEPKVNTSISGSGHVRSR